MAYPMEMYEDMFRKKTGAYFTKEEKKYIIDGQDLSFEYLHFIIFQNCTPN